jgi:hypothetical protein
MTQRIVAFKLTSGEEVIGTETALNDTFMTVRKCRSVGMQPMGNGQHGIGLMPYALGQHDGEINFRRDSVVAEFVPDPAFEKVYLQQTTSIHLMG